MINRDIGGGYYERVKYIGELDKNGRPCGKGEATNEKLKLSGTWLDGK